MTKPHPAEELIGDLLPLETFRSPWVPTLRLGFPALLGVADAIFGPEPLTAAPPDHWFAVDPHLRRVVAFAETAFLSPVTVSTSALLVEAERPMHPRDAHRALREGLDDVATAFFAGGRIPPEVAGQFVAAYQSALPGRLAPWLRECCADYFSWLNQQATAGGARMPPEA